MHLPGETEHVSNSPCTVAEFLDLERRYRLDDGDDDESGEHSMDLTPRSTECEAVTGEENDNIDKQIEKLEQELQDWLGSG